jgi:hypothetical protein
MTFHSYKGKYTKSDRYYLDYTGDIGFRRVCNIITSSNPLPKLETPAIVMNRFKMVRIEIQNGYVDTVKNSYANLDFTTGWFALDVDNTGKYTRLVKESLKGIEELRIIWVSSSGAGVKAIGFNPGLCKLTPQQYRTYYRWICNDIRKRAGLKINFDVMQGRCHQPVFLNSDKNAIIK